MPFINRNAIPAGARYKAALQDHAAWRPLGNITVNVSTGCNPPQPQQQQVTPDPSILTDFLSLGHYDTGQPPRAQRSGLGDLSTLPEDIGNENWPAVFGDLFPWIAGAVLLGQLFRGGKSRVQSGVSQFQGKRKRISAAKKALEAAQAESWF